MFSGNGVALAMPFLRFASHSAKMLGVFTQDRRKYQFAVLDTPLTCPAHGRTLPLPCGPAVLESGFFTTLCLSLISRFFFKDKVTQQA